jgi:predicted DCC family thiol-disulfide oxidoreductase YuxK
MNDEPLDVPPLLLFDGVCNVCNASVAFVLRHEQRPVVRFASLQGATGRALVQQHGIHADSVVLIEDGRVFVRTAAVIRVARYLRWPYRALAALWLIPWPLRDLGYAAFASVRYRIFGKRDSCMLPTPEVRARFVDDPVAA